MRIRSFSEFGCGIEFYEGSRDATVFELSPGEVVCGVGSIIEGVLVAFYKKEKGYFLQIGDDLWDASAPSLSVKFVHGNGGVSCLSVRQDGDFLREFIYSSWWLRYGEGGWPALGDPDDEEHDFGAYLAYIWQTDIGRKQLMQKYR
ncbi:hypothetical protein [Pseudomonas sp. R3-41]